MVLLALKRILDLVLDALEGQLRVILTLVVELLGIVVESTLAEGVDASHFEVLLFD